MALRKSVPRKFNSYRLEMKTDRRGSHQIKLNSPHHQRRRVEHAHFLKIKRIETVEGLGGETYGSGKVEK